jgi:hypothetical protein
LDFYDGKIVLNEDFKLLNSPELVLGGLGYKDLTAKYPRIAEIFDQYKASSPEGRIRKGKRFSNP